MYFFDYAVCWQQRPSLFWDLAPCLWAIGVVSDVWIQHSDFKSRMSNEEMELLKRRTPRRPRLRPCGRNKQFNIREEVQAVFKSEFSSHIALMAGCTLRLPCGQPVAVHYLHPRVWAKVEFKHFAVTCVSYWSFPLNIPLGSVQECCCCRGTNVDLGFYWKNKIL